MNPYDKRYPDPDSYRHRRSNLMGHQPPVGPPVMGATYGRGGPVPYGSGAPPTPSAFAGRGGPGPVGGKYPTFEPPISGFSMGRGSGGGGRGFTGGRVSNFHGGDRRNDAGRGRGWDSGRGGGRGFSVGGGRGGKHRDGGSRRELDNVALPKQDFGNLVPFEKNF